MHCSLVSVLMKTTLISKVAVPKMSSVYDDNFNCKTISACSNSQLRDKTLTTNTENETVSMKSVSWRDPFIQSGMQADIIPGRAVANTCWTYMVV